MKKLIHITLLLWPCWSFSQISGIINSYIKVTAIDNSCHKVSVDPTIASFTIDYATNFKAGEKVLLIQMKGADLDQTISSTYGNITDYKNAGNFEFATINNVNGNDIQFENTILKNYTSSGHVQLISIPQFTNVSISGVLTSLAWNGNIGGVLVFEASGTVTMNANIDVSTKGFRGGNVNPGSGSTCAIANIYAASASDVSGQKGEGIADAVSNRESGSGKLGNGGGGGNSNNCGGGGGSNFGKGGNGGYEAYLRTSTFSGCNLSGNGNPGIGGAALLYSSNDSKIFLGGGGGGGHQNNWTSPGPPTWVGGTTGGIGGGIVIIKTNTLNGNSNTISAQGGISPISRAWGDGAGGGGAGGSVILNIDNYINPLTVNVNGGKGDNVYDETSRDLGPGGGGGGGIVLVNNSTFYASMTRSLLGGASGIMVGSTTCQCAHGAVAGNNGGELTGFIIPKSTTANPCLDQLPVVITHFNATLLSNRVKIEWTSLSEKDNDIYIIEKSQGLNHFTLVGTVKSPGTNDNQNSYFIYDDDLLTGRTYYRLSQRDKDGTMSFLGIKGVSYFNEKLISKIYPVPFNDDLQIILTKDEVLIDDAIIYLINSLGQKVFETTLGDQTNVQLNLSYLPEGMYNIIVNRGEKMERASVIKVK